MLLFTQKRELQKLIVEQNKILAGSPSFSKKRQAQKTKSDTLIKLGKVAVKQPSSTETVNINDQPENSGPESSNGQAITEFENPTKAFVDYLNDSKGDSLEAAKVFFKEQLQGRYFKTVIGDVLLNGETLKEMRRGMASDDLKASLIAKVPDILKFGAYKGKENDTKNRQDFRAFHFFEMDGIDAGDVTIDAGVTVGERHDNTLVCDMRLSAYGLGHSLEKRWQKRKGTEPTVVKSHGAQPPSKGDTDTALDSIIVDSIGITNDLNLIIINAIDKNTGVHRAELEDSTALQTVSEDGAVIELELAPLDEVETADTALEHPDLPPSSNDNSTIGQPQRKPTANLYDYDPNRKTSQRKKDNAAAIAILKQIDSGELSPGELTDEHKAALAKYSGTGGNLDAANGKKGSAYEYYTPKPIAESMWRLLEELGFKGGKVLDPSAGVGIFGGTAPTHAAVDAVELNEVSGRINGLVNSSTGNSVTVSPFEAVAANTPDEVYDAIITNVPFGDNNARGGNQMLDKRYQSESLENYFILRSLEKLKPGGLAAYITPPRCVSGKKQGSRRLRERVSFKAEFLGAYRLPNSVFGTADADTITDIVVFRKYSKSAQEKIDELREQSPETLVEANICWDQFIDGNYFKGEGKRFVLGEFIPKTPNDKFSRDRIITNASVGEIGAMIKKFPRSRVNWGLLDSTETTPIIYQDGDIITQAGQTLEMRGGEWVAIKSSNNDNRAIELLSKMATPYEAFLNKVSFDDAKLAVDYFTKMSKSMDIPDWLRMALNKLNGMPEYWLAGLVGLSCDQILESNRGVTVNYLETYPELSSAMASVYSLAKTVPVGLSGNLKDGIKIMTTHYSKKKGYSAVWRGDILESIDASVKTVDQSFEGLRYQVKSQWVSLEDAKSVIGDDFDPFSSHEFCLSGDGTQVTKAGDYYIGNYADFLRKIDQEIASAGDEKLKEKLLRQKLDAEQYIDRIDPNSLTFNLFSPYVDIEYKLEFLRRFVDQGFAISIEKERTITNSDGKKVKVSETVDKHIVFEGKGDSDRAKLLNRFAQYLNKGTVTLGGAKVSMSNAEALAELRKMVSTANEQFGPWVKSNGSVIEGITKAANDPSKLRFKPVEDETAMPIPGLNTDTEKGGKEPHGYQYAFIRRQGREFGGINGFGVGLGKTLTSLAAVQHAHNIGAKKKTVFVVPNSVLSNWRKEAAEAYESIDDSLFVGLRTDKKGKDVVKSSAYDEDLTSIIENRHSKIFMSMEAFERIRMREPTIEAFAGYLRRVDASFAESEKNAEEEEKVSKLAKLMEGLRSKSGSAPFIEDMGIDSIVIDEAHMMKNSAMAVDTKQARYLSLSAPSARGFDAQAKAWFIRGQSPLKDGVLLLTATPITNSPLEVYSMLSLAIGHDKLNDAMLGIQGADQFLSVVCDIQGEQDLSIDGIERDINVFQGLNNVSVLRKALSSSADIKDADDVGSQVELPESEDKIIAIDLPDSINQRLQMYKSAFRYAVDSISGRDENRGDPDAYAAVADYFGEPESLIGHPFNLINKMNLLIADPELDRRGTFFTFSESQKALAEKVVAAFNKKKMKEKRSNPGPLTAQNMVVGRKVTKDSDTDATKIEYTIQVEARIDKNRITIDTMDSAAQTLFEDIAEKEGLELDVTIPPKLAALLENVQNEASNPRGKDKDGQKIPFAKQIIFCDILPLHNKIRRVLSKKAGIARSAIAIITGQTNNSPDEILDVQMGFNASGTDNKYRVIIANEKAEVGINLQIGTQAIHHLTIGWTPDSLTQRNGRGVRQGNKTERVSIYHYDAGGTFDVAKRSMVDKKSEWIDQVMDVNGSDKVEIKAGLSRQQMEELINVVGDGDGMAKLQASIAAQEAANRAKTNREKQLVSLSTVEKLVEFIKGNDSAESWAIKKIQALYAMDVQLKNLRNRLQNAKTETAIAKNEMAISDLSAKMQGLKRSINEAVAFTEYMNVDEFFMSGFGYLSRGEKEVDAISKKLRRSGLSVKEDSELFSDWRSEYDMAQAMIDESKASFKQRSKDAGGLPESVIDGLTEGEMVMTYGKPIINKAFARRDGVLLVVKDVKLHWGVAYRTLERHDTITVEEFALSTEIIYPGTPEYTGALIEAAKIEDALAEASISKSATTYSDVVGEVKNYRKNVGVAEYNRLRSLLPAPYFPYVIVEAHTPVNRAIAESQKAIVKSIYGSDFTVSADVDVIRSETAFDLLGAKKDYAYSNGMMLVSGDIKGYEERFKSLIASEIDIEALKESISGVEHHRNVTGAALNFVFDKIGSWFDPGDRTQYTSSLLPYAFQTAINNRVKAILASNENPNDVVAVSGRGTYEWKDTLKEFAEDHKPADYGKSYLWHKIDKVWLVSRAAWDAFAQAHPGALSTLHVELSNKTL